MNELIRGPMDEEWFQITPGEIERSLFLKQRTDLVQERVRTLIVDALNVIENDTRIYKKTFLTLRPAKKWSKASELYLIEQAHWSGDYLGTWIDQAAEWAQRIQNGEKWEVLCNEPDNLKWYRMIMWKDGEVRLIGGSTENNDYSSPVSITENIDGNMTDKLAKYTIPLVVKY